MACERWKGGPVSGGKGRTASQTCSLQTEDAHCRGLGAAGKQWSPIPAVRASETFKISSGEQESGSSRSLPRDSNARGNPPRCHQPFLSQLRLRPEQATPQLPRT